MRESEKERGLSMWKILQKSKFYLIAGLTAALLILFYLTAEPETCALCGGLKCHAPCIVDLATGEVGELEIYAPHPTLVGELAEEQPRGIFAFLPCVGLTAIQDQDAGTCTILLPDVQQKMNPRHFCKACRVHLAGMKGYALIDLYDLKDIHAYPIEDGATYSIRGYTVSVKWDSGSFHVVNYLCF